VPDLRLTRRFGDAKGYRQQLPVLRAALKTRPPANNSCRSCRYLPKNRQLIPSRDLICTRAAAAGGTISAPIVRNKRAKSG
jgi:hypothetical protein